MVERAELEKALSSARTLAERDEVLQRIYMEDFHRAGESDALLYHVAKLEIFASNLAALSYAARLPGIKNNNQYFKLIDFCSALITQQIDERREFDETVHELWRAMRVLINLLFQPFSDQQLWQFSIRLLHLSTKILHDLVNIKAQAKETPGMYYSELELEFSKGLAFPIEWATNVLDAQPNLVDDQAKLVAKNIRVCVTRASGMEDGD